MPTLLPPAHTYGLLREFQTTGLQGEKELGPGQQRGLLLGTEDGPGDQWGWKILSVGRAMNSKYPWLSTPYGEKYGSMHVLLNMNIHGLLGGGKWPGCRVRGLERTILKDRGQRSV